MNRHDLDSVHLSAVYSDTARIASVGFEDVKVGVVGYKDAYSRYFATSPDMVYTVTRVIVAGSQVVVEYDSEGTMAKPEKGEPNYMTGKRYRLKNCGVYAIAGGRIVREMTYFDQLSFLRQMDYFNQKR